MKSDYHKRNLMKPIKGGNCVVEEKITAKHTAKTVLEAMHRRDNNSPPKYFIFDLNPKREYGCSSKDQMKRTITTLLKENPNRTLKFSPNYEN